MGNIYAIIDTRTNNPIYVGQTVKTIAERWKEHINDTKGNRGFAVHNAMRKYGIENFAIQSLETNIDNDSLNDREQYWIKALHTHISENGYNLTWGGQNTSEALKKCVYQYDLEGNFIKEFPSLAEAERVLKISHSNICKVLNHELHQCGGYRWSYTKESRLPPISNNHTGSAKRIGQYDLQNNLIQIFSSTKEAAEYLGRSQGNISSAANGKRKTAYGFIWKFI